MLQEFLWRFCHKVFQIEGDEISDIFEFFLCDTLFCQREHVLGQWFNVFDEMCIWVIDDLHAFCSTIAEEIDRLAVKIFLVCVSIYDVCLYTAYLL